MILSIAEQFCVVYFSIGRAPELAAGG